MNTLRKTTFGASLVDVVINGFLPGSVKINYTAGFNEDTMTKYLIFFYELSRNIVYFLLVT